MKMQFKASQLMLIVLLVLCTSASAKILVAIPQHPNYSHPKHPGYLNLLIEEMGEFSDVEFSILPTQRAIVAHYQEKKYACLLGGDEKLLRMFGSDPKLQYFSIPHMAHKSHIFSKNQKICNIEDLTNKSLVVLNSFPYEKFFRNIKLKRVEKVHSLKQAIKMGVNGRADAFISYYPTPELLGKDIKFCKELSFTQTSDKIHCYKSAETLKFIKSWNKRLEKLKKKDKLKSMLEKSFPNRSEEILKQIK
ncbi:MAG: hypothetical protein CME64_08975 [Halobacteriovoraceae bacterium]|nr:hypothetical protein [Halobacteriovoraceae bacterium]